MKAWLLDSFGGLDGLRLTDVPEPKPQPGQVILSVHCAGLNPADRYLAEGAYPANPKFPHTLGRDAVGTVAAVGAGALAPLGQKMIVLRGEAGVTKPGTFAQFVSVPSEYLVDIPPGWSDQEAGGAALAYLTAYQALTMWHDLPAASLVLVTGASGGVGVASVQLAKALGHSVVALSRDPIKQSKLKKMGVDVAINPMQSDWPKRTREKLENRRVDLAIDNIGGPYLAQVIESLGEHGRVSCVGRLAGLVPQFNTASLFFRRLRMGGVAVGAYTADETRAAWGKVLSLLAKSSAKPLVDSVFPMEKLKEAFDRLHGGPMGKVILAVGEQDPQAAAQGPSSHVPAN